jgi:integrase
MAYVRAHETKQKRQGKPVRRYEVVWREPLRDNFGLPIPKNPARPDGPKKSRTRAERFDTREDAEARRDALNAARHTIGTASLADQRKAGELPFGHYTRAWLDSQQIRVASGKLKADSLKEYERLLVSHALPEFGPRAIASISPAHCEQFLTTLVARGVTPKTVSAHWNLLRRVLRYAVRHGAIVSSPADRVEFSAGHATGDRERFEHHPLIADQVAAVAASIGSRYPVYELMTLFLAYSGLRAAECAGLEIADLAFSPGPAAMRASVNVRRTKARKGGQWVTGTLKSKRSRRTVPLPPWLGERLRTYLDTVHPRGNEPTAPLWPSRAVGGYRAPDVLAIAPLDWSEPPNLHTFYETVMKPALVAAELPASLPAHTSAEGTSIAATKGVRLHDLRHTFATMQLSSGVHFMQVSKWLGHGTFTLTLDTYGDWIPESDGGVANALPEPVAPAEPAEAAILPFRRASS